MTTTRTVTGILHHTPDTAWVGASVVFVLISPFAVVGATYPPERVTATTDSNGAFSQALSVPAAAADACRYRCELPNGIAFEFNLSTGAGSVTLESLFIQSISTATPNALQVLIDAHAAVVASTTVLGHVKVDGSTITATAGGVLSAAGGGPPTGAAGGVLGGTYPNPGFAADMATQAELDAHAAAADPHPVYLTPAEAGTVYQPLDSDLTAIATLTTTAYGRSLLEAATAAALRTLAGLIIGTDVQAQDAELAALAGLTSAADKLPYFTGSGTAALADFTAAARALTDDVSAAAMRTTLAVNAWRAVADADYTAVATDLDIGYTSITAPRTVTLPLANAVNAGQVLVIGDVSGNVTGTNTITIARAGSDTINGATSYVIRTPRGLVRLISDGASAWYFDIVGPARGGAIAAGRPKQGATTYYTIPGVAPSSVATLVLSADFIQYMPIRVDTQITLDQLALEVTVAGAAGKIARMGIYNADLDWQPTILVVDAGTVAADSTGIKTAAISVTLAPGRYLFASYSNGTPTVRTVQFLATGGYDTALGTTAAISKWLKSGPIASFADPGNPWNSITNGNVGLQYHVWCRVSVP